LVSEYDGKVKVVHKYFVVHQAAVVPGLAACAAHAQGKYPAMQKLIWERGYAEGQLGSERMEELAREAGLDLDAYQAEMRGDRCMERLQRNYQQLSALGVDGTPTLYVNGRYLSGIQPIEIYRALIDEELAKADAAIKAGTPVGDYYRKHVLEPGKTSP
jgi:protein-disulfide isomerase